MKGTQQVTKVMDAPVAMVQEMGEGNSSNGGVQLTRP